ncbi:YcjF family protein [bacterium]|nr:YcjF family protein [bacterium]
MADDHPDKPKVNRSRRRPYEQAAAGGTKKRPAKATGSRPKTTKKIASRPTRSTKSGSGNAPKPKTEAAVEATPLETKAGPAPDIGNSIKVVEVEEPLTPKADKVVRNHVIASMGFGLIPIPIVDIASLIPVQMSLVAELAELYGCSYKRDRDRSVMAGVLTGILSHHFASGKYRFLVHTIPVVGPLLSMATFPVFAGASTYAVGKVFIQHFETGGTLLDFKPEKVKSFFREQYEQGKRFASGVKTGK